MGRSRYLRSVLCPRHDDHEPSFAIYDDGHGHCYVCGYHAPVDLASLPPAKPRWQYQGPLPWALVRAYERVLWQRFPQRLGWLVGRGLHTLTIRKLHLGHTGAAFTIPVWTPDRLVTIKYRRDERLAPDGPKYRNLPGATACLYGLWQPLGGRVVLLCEGELDAALLMQELWRTNREHCLALATTGGAGQRNAAIFQPLAGARGCLVLYDQDAAGQAGAERLIPQLRAVLPWVWQGSWPAKWGKDVTEAIGTVGFERFWREAVGPWLGER